MPRKKKATPDPIELLLSLEIPVRQAADELPDGPNVDAVKSAYRNAAHGIAHIRKVIDANRRLER